MDLKSDDILNIDIDSALLLSYELDKLNLDSIPNDIFEFSEEIPKHCDNVDIDSENALLAENKRTETSVSEEKCILESTSSEALSCTAEIKLEAPSRNHKRKKDINGNEPSSCENLNQLFGKLELSDSDNEEDEGCTKLKERAPERTISRAKKNRDQNNILSKNKNHDKSEFNLRALKFMSGSSQIELNEPKNADQFAIHPNLTSMFTGSEIVPLLPSQDHFYGDVRAKVVGSPESGYESSSAQSGSSSPPLLPLSATYNLDFIPETVDEQNILEFLVENTTDCALTHHSLSACDSDGKDAKGKIIEIINYLKDIPEQLNELSDVAAASNNIHECVPLISNTQDLSTESLSVLSNPVLKNAETPKKLVYKLNDKAKRTLREFLSDDEFYAAEARIYKKINEDMGNSEGVKVIYVEDETDKVSENRTNLHHAVLDSRIEDIYCLVEIHKQYNKPFTDINIRDKYGKTALDYAIQNQMTLVVDYLKENTACQSVNI